MSTRLAYLAAVLSLVALGLWLWPDARAGSRTGGGPSSLPDGTWDDTNPSAASAVPCAVPLAWRVARVDSRFGIDEARVGAVVEEAADLWEDRVGTELFRLDPDGGFPIRLVYDERQARSREIRREEEQLAATDDRLQGRARRLEQSGRSYREARADLEARSRDLQERFARLNDSIRSWNESGGAPPPVRIRLEREGRSLEAESDRLQTEADELDEWRRRLQRQREELEAGVEERAGEVRELEERYPDRAVESGLYREAVEERGGRVVELDREIRIYRFDDADELRLILAHELGHALGVGHAEEPGALMSVQYIRGAASDGGNPVGSTDLELLRRRCPALF